MEQLKSIWSMVNNRYGAWVALAIVLAVLGIAWWLGVTPSVVMTWIGS
jgi:hypothetical protein